MARTYVRRRLVAVALLVGVLSLPAAAVGAFPGDRAAPGARTQVVRSGDTLWEIARRAEPGRDPREAVSDLAALNGVDAGALVPGQVLILPAG